MITERDLNILKFVNDFNFIKCKYACDFFMGQGYKDTAIKRLKGPMNQARKRLKNLEKEKLLISVLDVRNREKIYYLSKNGISFLNNFGIKTYDSNSKINRGNIIHDETVIEIYNLFRFFGFPFYVPEKQARSFDVFSENEPDLIIFDDNNQFVCVEVELSPKTIRRIEKKVENLGNYANVSKILYLCKDQQIFNSISRTVYKGNKNDKFHLYLVHEFFANSENIIKKIMGEAHECEH